MDIEQRPAALTEKRWKEEKYTIVSPKQPLNFRSSGSLYEDMTALRFRKLELGRLNLLSLELFVESLGFDPVLSEKGDIASTSDRPLDESCYREVENAQMFILIVGGRYGLR